MKDVIHFDWSIPDIHHHSSSTGGFKSLSSVSIFLFQTFTVFYNHPTIPSLMSLQGLSFQFCLDHKAVLVVMYSLPHYYDLGVCFQLYVPLWSRFSFSIVIYQKRYTRVVKWFC